MDTQMLSNYLKDTQRAKGLDVSTGEEKNDFPEKIGLQGVLVKS